MYALTTVIFVFEVILSLHMRTYTYSCEKYLLNVDHVEQALCYCYGCMRVLCCVT
jgi:hypothetical protein